MSDKALAILDEIETILTTETATGETLEDVNSFFVLRTSADTPPEFGSLTPVLVVSLQPMTAERIFLSSPSMKKTQPVRFSLFTENAGDTEDSEAARLIDLVENVFTGETFDLSFYVETISKDYTQATIPPFSGDWNGAAELIMQHLYTDMRACT